MTAVPLQTLLSIASNFCDSAFAAQIVVGISAQLEKVLGMSNKANAKVGPLPCTIAELQDDVPGRHVVDRRLLQYVMAGLRLTKDHREYHFCTDKAWVGGLPLRFAVVTVASGHYVLSVLAVLIIREGSSVPGTDAKAHIFQL